MKQLGIQHETYEEYQGGNTRRHKRILPPHNKTLAEILDRPQPNPRTETSHVC